MAWGHFTAQDWGGDECSSGVHVKDVGTREEVAKLSKRKLKIVNRPDRPIGCFVTWEDDNLPTQYAVEFNGPSRLRVSRLAGSAPVCSLQASRPTSQASSQATSKTPTASYSSLLCVIAIAIVAVGTAFGCAFLAVYWRSRSLRSEASNVSNPAQVLGYPMAAGIVDANVVSGMPLQGALFVQTAPHPEDQFVGKSVALDDKSATV